MSIIFFIYGIGALALAVGLSGNIRTAAGTPFPWPVGLAAMGAWIQLFCIVFYALNHGAGSTG